MKPGWKDLFTDHSWMDGTVALHNSEKPYLTSKIPSGKRLHNYGKIQHAINGEIHYFDWAIFNSFLYVYQRVS